MYIAVKYMYVIDFQNSLKYYKLVSSINKNDDYLYCYATTTTTTTTTTPTTTTTYYYYYQVGIIA